ncbi:MAG: glycosyltransferase [Pseudomonadota bacterium]
MRALSVFINWCITDQRYNTEDGFLFKNLKAVMDSETYRFFLDCLKAGEYEQAFDLYVAYLTEFGPLDNHTLPQLEIIDYYKLDRFDYFVELERADYFHQITNIQFPYEKSNQSDRTIKNRLQKRIAIDPLLHKKISDYYKQDTDFFASKGLTCHPWRKILLAKEGLNDGESGPTPTAQRRDSTKPVSFDQKSYTVFFPLFDHIEAHSNEVRLTRAGLEEHPRVELVDDPEAADFLFFCQNHFNERYPRRAELIKLKDRYKFKTIFLDFDDDPFGIYDKDDFTWRLYFKRSCVNRKMGCRVDYDGLPIVPTAYCVVDKIAEVTPPQERERTIDVACLFDDHIVDSWVYKKARGRLLQFAKEFREKHDFNVVVGTVSETGQVGRSGLDDRYKDCLLSSKIVLHANPDPWEGDSRTWEALSSGALVFVDKMVQPIKNPLVDGEHVIFYDVSDEGFKALEQAILHYLNKDDERKKIALCGQEFVHSNHRPVHRIGAIISRLDGQAEALNAEIAHMANQQSMAPHDYLQRVYRLCPGQRIRTTEHGCVLDNTATGNSFACNQTAASFLSKIDGQRSVEKLAVQMAHEFHAQWYSLAKDVYKLVFEFERLDVIEVVKGNDGA